MKRSLTIVIVWIMTVPVGIYWLLDVVINSVPRSVDPLWFSVPLITLFGALGHLVLKQNLWLSLVMIVAVPAIHWVFRGGPDPAAPLMGNLFLLVEFILLLIGWSLSYLAFKIGMH